MINFALLGSGRIGQMHANLLDNQPFTKLLYVHDTVASVAYKTANKHRAEVADINTILTDKRVNAVLIASSTETHIDLMVRATQSGKAVLCEKPLDLDINKIDSCVALMESTHTPFQIGFNRRFDPNHRALANAVAKGEIGKIEALIISSRDPAAPAASYLKKSGGLFRDMMIHDFDMARYILGEEPQQIHAVGSVQIDPEIGALGDIDSAMVTMKTKSGALCHINCSRRSVYGYDQRIEAFGSEAMLISDNPQINTVKRYDKSNSAAPEAMQHFFIERYQQAYKNQLAYFVECLQSNKKPEPNFNDGRQALKLANAAQESLETGKSIKLN